MNGNINGRQPQVRVTFRLPNGQNLGIDFVIDTGFEGTLTLPPYAVAAMQLPLRRNISATLADGSSRRVDEYVATIEWHNQDMRVSILAMGNRPLLGTAMLDGSDVAMHFEDRGPITIVEF